MALLAVLGNPHREAMSILNPKAATPAETELLRLAAFPQIRSKISGALARKRPIQIHVSGPRGEFVRFRLVSPKKYMSFAVVVLAPKELRGLTPTEARKRLGTPGLRRLTLGVIGRMGPGKSELQSVLVPKSRVMEVAGQYLRKPAAVRVARNPLNKFETGVLRSEDAYLGKRIREERNVYRMFELLGEQTKTRSILSRFGKKLARRNPISCPVCHDSVPSMKALNAHLRKAHRNPAYSGVSSNRRRSRRNPFDIATSWTGRKADYVSPVGNYGEAGYSELAMHVGIAGKKVVQFALWSHKNSDRIEWAHVKTADGRVTDGRPHEVLPAEVIRKLPGEYSDPRMPSSSKMLFNRRRKTSRRVRRNPSYPGAAQNEVAMPFRPGKQYSVEQVDKWIRAHGTPAMQSRWMAAYKQFKSFHKNADPRKIKFVVQNVGIAKGITDIDFVVSEGKEWMAPYQVPAYSGKHEHDGSQGRYVHAHGDSQIEVDIKKPAPLNKLPERFHTPDGKFVGVIPSKNVKISDWYRG